MGEIVNELITFDSENGNFKWFVEAVKSKDVKNYYNVIKKPMCLWQMKQKTQNLEYLNIDWFLEDVDLIYQNSSTFNGPQSLYTQQADRIW